MIPQTLPPNVIPEILAVEGRLSFIGLLYYYIPHELDRDIEDTIIEQSDEVEYETLGGRTVVDVYDSMEDRVRNWYKSLIQCPLFLEHANIKPIKLQTKRRHT